MRTSILIRLDDACPTMNHKKWDRMEMLLDKSSIKPMVGVIPHNEDSKQQIDLEDPDFWNKIKIWEEKNWTIALHGYNHVYSSKDGGMNPLWLKSEFAGHSLEIQKEKIKKGVAIFRSHGINPKYFFAPSHTFDENTLIALKEESDIRIISDTIALKPYEKDGFVFIPQQSGHPISLPFNGILTVCYHPNTMKDDDFVGLEKFIKAHEGDVIGFSDLDFSKIGSKSIIDKIFSGLYFLRRKIRSIVR